MAIRSRPQRVIPYPPIVGAIVGAAAAVAFAILPMSLVENAVIDSGIASVVAAAAPPLGFTARLLMVVFGSGALGVIAWFATFLLLGRPDTPITGNGFVLRQEDRPAETAPVLRRADAHPDAPSRAPLRADRDLGTRLLDDPPVPDPVMPAQSPAVAVDLAVPTSFAGRSLPDDLDQPLAAYDAVASVLHSRGTSRAPAQGDRSGTYVGPSIRVDPADTIHSLLDRLERVVQRRPVERAAGAEFAPTPASPPTPGGFEDTLATLRALAQRSV